MTGIPSIVAGLFALALVVLFFGPAYRMGLGGSVALSLLMIPTVVRSAEEMFRLVPMDLREASYALGVPKWRTILKVVVPTAIGGVITGVVLAISRVIGETAPLLVVAGATDGVNFNLFDGRMTTLPVFIYSQYAQSTPAGYERAWGGALVLIAIVMVLNLDRARAWQAPRPEESLTRKGTATMAKSIDVCDLEHLLRRLPRRRGRHDDHQGAVGDRVHRAVRLRQVHDAALAEPHARGDPRRPGRGQGDGRRAEPLRP